MIFSLEVFQAKQGDCLILHYGDSTSPGIIVIDGGPSGIYLNHLKPRLSAIKQTLVGDEQLPLKMVMVSHADDDHINGILALTDDLLDQVSDNRLPEFDVRNFWFNSFDDIIGNNQVVTAALATPLAAIADGHVAASIASTRQGRRIRDKARQLGWQINEPFTKLEGSDVQLVRSDTDQSRVMLGELRINVVHPSESRLKELQTQWDIDLQKAQAAGDNSILLASLQSKDTSPFNLSSIVCLVEFSGQTVLLTGDGRSDDIYSGLRDGQFLNAEGKLHVDILKMPHHGSDANMTDEFLQKITADHYVISADGKHNNPDQHTLDMVANNIERGTLYLTNHEGEFDLKAKLDGFIADLEAKDSELKVVFRDSQKSSVVINLLDILPY